MIKMNVARMRSPELALVGLLEVNAAVMTGFDLRTATPEEHAEFEQITDALCECCDSLEAIIASQKQERAS